MVNEATRILCAAGVSAIKEDASIKKTVKQYRARGGAVHPLRRLQPPDRARASVSYDDSSEKPLADAWHALYSPHWKFRWMKDKLHKEPERLLRLQAHHHHRRRGPAGAGRPPYWSRRSG
ncbi:MAG TPA: hypothetical protein VF710_13320 [Longimicrobium sp.]